MADDTIKCRDCSIDFVFTEGEAKFFADKGFQPPRRCKPCRDKKKAQDSGTTSSAPAYTEEQQPQQSRRKGGRKDDRDDRY